MFETEVGTEPKTEQDAATGAPPAPRISVVLCTYDRAQSLQRTLRTLVDQSVPRAEYEVLVVDNRSTDATCAVVHDIQADHPECRIRLLHEDRPGLNHARNTGLQQARGRYVAFTDDDVRLPEDWLQVALSAFEAVEPAPLGLGGPVFPFYAVERPAWFKDEYETDTWGDVERFLVPGESFSGNNMFFRKEALQSIGGFVPGLDMEGCWIGVAGDTHVFERIWRAEPLARLYYLPGLEVLHAVPPYRMRIGYIVKRLFVTGQSWHARQGRASLGGRALGIGRAAAVVVRGMLRAALAVSRHRVWQQWVVEDARELIAGLGHASASLGFRLRVRERPLPTSRG
jgi:glucosyl-dolichyl phosphate glucuronosyltransferase